LWGKRVGADVVKASEAHSGAVTFEANEKGRLGRAEWLRVEPQAASHTNVT